MQNEHGSNGTTASRRKAESGAEGEQLRLMKRVKLEEDLDIEVQSLLSLPAPSAAGGVSVSAPGAVSEGRPLGRPRRGKRGPRGKACMTREQREQELLKDQRISAVEARQVLCRMCGRWIKLCRQSDFVMQNWNTHAVRCQEKTGWLTKVKREPENTFDLVVATEPEPLTVEEKLDEARIKKEEGISVRRTNRGLTVEDRKRILEADRRIKRVEPHQVQCAMCDREVKLHNFRSYERWNWTQHAKKCEARGRAGPISDVTTNGTTLVDETTVESETEVEADLVAPSPSVQTPVEESSHYRDVQATLPKLTLRFSYYRDVPSADEVDDSKADSSAVPIPSTSSTRVKREPSDYLPDGSSIPTPPVLSTTPALLTSTSVSAPVPRKPSPSVKVSSFTGRLAGARHNKKGRNEDERKKALEADTRCSEVRPHEVFCLLCKRWIKLYRDVTYIDSNWLRHAERCELRNGVVPRKKRRLSSPPVDVKPIPVEDALAEDAVAESSQAAAKRMRELQDDPRITKVEAHQVLCGVCKQWIKLQPYREHDTWNWRKHIPNCVERHRQGEGPAVQDKSDPSPKLSPSKQAASTVITNIESAEGRKKVLEEDGRCTEVEPHRVLCLICKRHIGLHANKDYSLANWYKHTQACSKKIGLSNLTQSAPPIQHQRAEAPIATESISAAPRRARVAAQDNDIVEISRKEAEASLAGAEFTSVGGKTGIELRRDNMLKDPRIGALEPNRVFCKSCNSWLKLSEQIPYIAYNWRKHADRCEEKSRAREEALLTVVVKAQSPEIVLLDGPPLTAPPAVRRGKVRARATVEERHARMSADDRIKVLEPHRAQCSFCDRWIKLQSKVEYDPTNWNTHASRCALKSRPDANPNPVLTQVNKIASPQKRLVYPMVDMKSSPVKLSFLNAEGRREALLSDSRAAAVEAHRVQCALCQQWIKLKDDKAFFGHNFYKHADRCERKNNASATPADESSAVVPIKADIIVKMEEESGSALNGSGTTKSKNEARLAELLADPRQGGVERGRVLCKMCNHWIKLNSSNSFLPGNWRRHASRCQKAVNWQGPTLAVETSAVDPRSVEIIDLEIEDEEGPVDLSLFGFVELGRLVNAFEPSVSSTEFAIRPSDLPKEKKKLPITVPIVRNLRARMSSASVTPKPEEPLSISAGKRPHRNEIHRKEELERDPRARIVLAEKILCAMCDKWIQMRRDISYSGQNWLKHAESCQNRMGFMKKLDRASQTPEMIAQEQEEEILPYNAKNCVAVDEVELANDVPSFKPVDWQQEVVASDGEDEDDYPISPGVYIPETSTEYIPIEGREERTHSVIVKQEPTETLDLTLPSAKEKVSGAVPTSLTFLHLRKPSNGDQNASLGVKVEPDPKKGRNSTSKSPPMINPFTTTPLSRPLTTFAPPIIAPLPGQSISEFATATHAEENAGTNHPYSTGPSFALQPSTVHKLEAPFMEVLTPPPALTTMPRASFGSVTYGRLLLPPGVHSPVSADRPYLYQGMPYYPAAQPFRQQPATSNTQNYPMRPNGPLTPISAVLGPRPPVVLPRTNLRPPQHSSAAAAVQLTPYPNIPYRTIDPNPTIPSIPSIPSPLTTIMRDRPPMLFTSQLSPISVSHNRFMHTPPIPSPHFESQADRQ